MILFLLLIPIALFSEIPSVQLMVGGAKADNPQVGFYGYLDRPVPSAAILDTDLGGIVAKVKLECQEEMPFCHFPSAALTLSSAFFYGNWSSKQQLGSGDGLDLLSLYAIDGSGNGLLLPLTQVAAFQTEEWLSDSAFLGRFFLESQGPFSISLLAGPALLFRSLEVSSSLRDFESSEYHGEVRERVSSLFVGGRVGLSIGTICSGVNIELTPEVTFYGGWHRLSGQMDFGVNDLPDSTLLQQTQHGAYDAKICLSVSKPFRTADVGFQLFAHFLSYTPSIYNPRNGEDGSAHLVNQNATLWGGTIFLLF